MLRLAGSLKRGWVTASLFISKLQAYPRQNVLTRAIQAYGQPGQDALYPALSSEF